MYNNYIDINIKLSFKCNAIELFGMDERILHKHIFCRVGGRYYSHS